MTYWALNAVFLVPALALALVAWWMLRKWTQRKWTVSRSTQPKAGPRPAAVLPQSGSPSSSALRALARSAALLLALTAVFDNAMIAAGLFGYSPHKISGALLGLAPLEDFAYPVAAVLLLPGLWLIFGAGGDSGAEPDRTGEPNHTGEPTDHGGPEDTGELENTGEQLWRNEPQ